MLHDELKDLLEKYLDNRITPEETRRLQALMQTDRNGPALEEMIAAILAEDRYTDAAHPDLQQAFNKVMETAALRQALTRKDHDEDTNDSAQQPVQEADNRYHISRKKIRTFYKTMAAAAAVAFILAAGYTWRYYYVGPAPLVSKKTVSPISTGNKAELILADGSTIVLDNAGTGTVGKQGNTRIIKLDSGRLAYHAAGSNSTAPEYNTIRTPKGGQYQVVLPDGSQVWLNAASSLTFPVVFAGSNRTVRLTGEAYFEIARQAAKPFIVQTSGVQVKVLGTHFNVMAYTDEARVKTTLLEGAVSVTQGAATTMMKPGQQASIAEKEDHFLITRPDMEEVMAWKEGQFRFRKTDITVIMRQIARWYDVDIEYEGDLSGIQLFGSMTRKENVTQLLELLEQTGRVHFIVKGNRITVMPATMK
ncbi:FecR family protein [Chitinophaga ginsengisegetis]|uniref:FecR family protein n=1 Tax=Chitinophaga ginsengisegetis TaxID=393003 RepID=UPI000DBA6EDA|nr:FecR family protein [Chitinophaga ginsengisegetis]MDR6570576.1 ferric-dicitrate binding protein FerR (iron transport regulator) [Chitinophaga ginsengisegetis]MDR6650310.1 ferric-dicitrate binding protein FerR (iron transport regulator) [Chitinophaga ginsengisegetis]MDR6656571.1 ferric-dicitrate binding protein FerR (iron transport regulator) [Chitinophaga ginsengisegetis]